MNLSTFILDHIVKNGKLSESDARKKFWQILSAIDYCHKSKVVHRDLKVGVELYLFKMFLYDS